MKRVPIFGCLLLALLLTAPGVAGAVAVQETDPATAPPPDSAPADSRLKAFHTYLSENVETLSWKIDSFFGATRVYEEYRGNYVQVRGSVILGRGGNIEYDGNLRAKFDLPNLAKKVNLVLESESDGQTSDSRITTPTGSTLSNTVTDKNINASLQFILQEQERWDVRLQPGIKVKLPLDPFVRVRFRYLKPLGATWLGRGTLTPGWYNSRGWEGRARLDLERVLGSQSLFRASSEAVWLRDDSRNLVLTQSFFLAHPVGDKEQMAYEVGVGGEIDPSFRDTSYFASIRYRRDIHQGWMFLEVKPQVVFDREQDFATDASLVLTLEMLFGRDYL